MDASPDGKRPRIWTSLEVSKLVASLVTPLVIVMVGQQLTNSARREAADRERVEKQEAFDNQRQARVVEKRVQLWDQMAPRMNDVYCYFLYVGNWKELRAADIVQRKRELDRIIYSYRPFFSDVFFKAYNRFTDAAFRVNNGARQDAKLRTSDAMRVEPEKDRLTGEDNAAEVHQAYYAVLAAAADELSLKTTTPPLPAAARGR